MRKWCVVVGIFALAGLTVALPLSAQDETKAKAQAKDADAAVSD